MKNINRTELLSPAGDFETARAAFAAGADAVYCGLADFSARAFAQNFTLEELAELKAYAGERKVYVTFNTLLDEDRMEEAIATLSRLENVGIDGLIVQDLGVAKICREYFPGLKLHASTQMVAHNLEGVLALGELGFERVVLARELSLEEISSISKRCGKIELECFIHGALCYSLSGLCLYGAMEKGRSGNRGKCPYCCRQEFSGIYPFSMKDLRLGEEARRLADAGVASLKIEGRMKSPLYVSSVTAYYRGILDGTAMKVTESDLETVFSRKTTELYLNGRGGESPVDAAFIGHRGTAIGTVKKIAKDRDGSAWLRFHATRALEKHDGLQFDALTDEGRRFGFGIGELRRAISRRNVFETEAGEDVEVRLPESYAAIKPGDTVYCSMSNAVKRIFPVPSFRPGDFAIGRKIDVVVFIAAEGLKATACAGELVAEVECAVKLEKAKSPEKTFDAVKKAMSKLGGTGYRLGELKVVDEAGLFVPASVLNDLRRDLVERLESSAEASRSEKLERISEGMEGFLPPEDGANSTLPKKVLKLRAGQKAPAGDWDEIVLAVKADDEAAVASFGAGTAPLRLALPVYNAEGEFNRLRTLVKRLLRAGYAKWEASDLATLRMLRQLGVEDITADWTLYAFNYAALSQLRELGVKRMTASPENDRANLAALVESGYAVECLSQQSTPLFISLTEPAAKSIATPGGVGHTALPELAVYRRGGLWVTTKRSPRTFDVPAGAIERIDLSWDPE